jgi:hypothetical protein
MANMNGSTCAATSPVPEFARIFYQLLDQFSLVATKDVILKHFARFLRKALCPRYHLLA